MRKEISSWTQSRERPQKYWKLYKRRYRIDAEQERETIRKRQAEGIEAAKQNGKKLGCPALVFPENWNSVYTSWKAGEITAKTAMEQTGTKRTSFYKLVNMTEKQ